MVWDWYSDYLRLIYPRSVEDELSDAHPNVILEDLVKVANDSLRLCRRRLYHRYCIADRSLRCSSYPSIEVGVERLGALRTISSNNPKSTNESLNVFQAFELMAQKDSSRFFSLLIEEVESRLSDKLADWEKFVKIFTEEDDPQKPIYFWDLSLGSPVVYEGDIPYEDFLIKGKNDPTLLRLIDGLDYLEGLFDRYQILRTMQFGKPYIPNYLYFFEKLAMLDTAFREKTEFHGFMLAEDLEKYYPRSHFWWFYVKPKLFHIDFYND